MDNMTTKMASFRQKREQLQQLYQTASPEEVAEILDHRCPHCGVLIVPEIQTFEAPWTKEGTLTRPIFPPCDCAGACEAAVERLRDEDTRRKATAAAAFRLRLHHAGLQGWLAEATLDNYRKRAEWPEATGLCVQVRRFVDAVLQDQVGDRCWLILYGRYGTGKTHLAAAAIHEALRRGLGSCYFRSWTEYLKRLQASWDREPGEQRSSDIVQELRQGKLVALDDLDKRRDPSGWAREELYTALNYRYNARLPTILTFNEAPSTPDPDAPGRLMLERFMSRAIIDRVIGAKWSVLNFDGPSYRSGVTWAM
jgi:DNA replication protein DnaC